MENKKIAFFTWLGLLVIESILLLFAIYVINDNLTLRIIEILILITAISPLVIIPFYFSAIERTYRHYTDIEMAIQNNIIKSAKL